MDVWRNLEQLKAAVQEGVKEFSNVAINEVRTGVQTIQQQAAQQQSNQHDDRWGGEGVVGGSIAVAEADGTLTTQRGAKRLEDRAHNSGLLSAPFPPETALVAAQPDGPVPSREGTRQEADFSSGKAPRRASTPSIPSETASDKPSARVAALATSANATQALSPSGAHLAADPSVTSAANGTSHRRADQGSTNGLASTIVPDAAATGGVDSPSYAFNTRSRTARTADALFAEAAGSTGASAAGLPAARTPPGSGMSAAAPRAAPGQGQALIESSGLEGVAPAQCATSSTPMSSTASSGMLTGSSGPPPSPPSAGDPAAAGENAGGSGGVGGSNNSGRPPLGPATGPAAAMTGSVLTGVSAREGSRRASAGGATGEAVPAAGRSAFESDADLRKAYADMKQAYDDMKGLLKKSMDECVRLSEEVVRVEGMARQAQAQAADQASAARAAKKEAADSNVALTAARKEAAAAERALAKVKAQLEAKEQQESSKVAETAELDVLRGELAAAVRKAMAAVAAKEAAEARAVQADTARQEAEQARNEADRLRREAEAEAHAALAAAEAERNSRAEAQGMSEALKAESERRARVFNNAVKAAVGKVQRELEAERDELQAQLRASLRSLGEIKEELRLALAAADEAAAEAEARTRDAAAAGTLAVAAEAAAERAVARETEAMASAQAAEAARHQLQAELEQIKFEKQESDARARVLDSALASLRAEAERERSAAATTASELERELRRQAERAEAATSALAGVEKQLEGVTAAQRDTAEKAAADMAAAMRRVEELEGEIATLRTSSKAVMSLFQLPTKEDVLAGLGLEMWKDDRLRWKSEDVEAPVPTAPRLRVLGDKDRGPGGALRRATGHISLRMWLIIGYLLLLHVAVMVSFTRNAPDVASLCGSAEAIKAVAEHKGPGLQEVKEFELFGCVVAAAAFGAFWRRKEEVGEEGQFLVDLCPGQLPYIALQPDVSNIRLRYAVGTMLVHKAMGKLWVTSSVTASRKPDRTRSRRDHPW